MRFRFDDFDGRTNHAWGNQLFVVGESVSVEMVGGQQKAPHEAVDERQSDQRVIEDAVGPEQLVGEQRQHVGPAATRACFDRHGRCEVDLRRQLPAERIAERILDNRAVDLHAQ
jgi:hypothetical protein